jgi:hypothetical protein
MPRTDRLAGGPRFKKETANARGTERGARMLGAYVGMYPNDHGFGLDNLKTAGPAADLIADILHAATSYGLDPDDVLRLAQAHYNAEQR